MGRFRIAALHEVDSDGDDDDDDDNNNGHRHWDFVGDSPGENDALVVASSSSSRESTLLAAAPTTATEASSRSSPPQHDGGWLRHESRQWEEAVPYHWEDEEPKTRPRSYKLLYLSLLIALVALCWKDPPPAPPQSHADDSDLSPFVHTSWTDYITKHGQQLTVSATALGIHTPWHVVSWLGASVVTDVQLLLEKVQKLQRAVQCQQLYYVPPTNLQQELQQAVVGQPLAVELLSDAVQAWSSLTNNHDNKDPLVVLAVGYIHTGKRTLAMELASRIRDDGKCATTHDDNNNSNVLHLTGGDWKLDVHNHLNEDSSISATATTTAEFRLFRKLAHTIEAHMHRASSGAAVILVTNVEDMEPGVSSRLFQALGGTTSTFEQHIDSTSIPDLRRQCRNSIVYLTSSSIGLTHITRSLRATGGSLLDAVSLAGDLKDAVHQHFGNSQATETIITAILPFGPFTPDTLAQLFRKRVAVYSNSITSINVATWKQFVVTDAAIAAFLDERRVEYLEWWRSQRRADNAGKSHGSAYSNAVTAARLMTAPASETNNNNNKKSNQEAATELFMKVAVEGAKVLDDNGPIMTKIYAQVNQLLTINDYPQQPDKKVAVLDYDATAMLDSNRGILQWCTDEKRRECREVRRFRI
jgi:hypothetical protein